MDDLETYKAQLEQVQAALTTDPDNEDLLKLQKDLEEVINLTLELATVSYTFIKIYGVVMLVAIGCLNFVQIHLTDSSPGLFLERAREPVALYFAVGLSCFAGSEPGGLSHFRLDIFD